MLENKLSGSFQQRLLSEIEKHLEQEQWLNLLNDAKILKECIIKNKLSEVERTVNLLIKILVKLNNTAAEYHYHRFLNRIFVQPLEQWSEKNSDKNNQLKESISSLAVKINLRGSINATALYEHKKEPFTEFDLKEIYPQYKDNLIEQICSIFKKDRDSKSGQRLIQHRLIESIIIYWRSLALKNDFFEKDELTSLYELGNFILNLPKPELNEEIRYVLLLQAVTVMQQEVKFSITGAMQQAHSHWKYLEQTRQNQTNEFLENICGSYLNDCAITYTTNISPELFIDYRPLLKQTRSAFEEKNKTPTEKQKIHSQAVIDFLAKLTKIAMSYLGPPPCDFALCIVGSTSRYDRRPYSDIELMALVKSRKKTTVEEIQRKHIESYVFHIISLLELLIVNLRETGPLKEGDSDNGFHIDNSCHILDHHVFGAPEEIIENFFNKAVRELTNNEHPWISDQHFYSLMNAVFVYGNEGGDVLYQEYQQKVRFYLDQNINSEIDKIDVLIEYFKGIQINHEFILSCTRRQVIAVSCLFDVLQKSIQKIKKIKSNETINIKDVYYKPLAYFAMNLKLYYGTTANSPTEVLEEIKPKLQWGERNALSLLQRALECIAGQQIKLHRARGFQEEEMLYWKITDNDTNLFWENVVLLENTIIWPLFFQFIQWLWQRVVKRTISKFKFQ